MRKKIEKIKENKEKIGFLDCSRFIYKLASFMLLGNIILTIINLFLKSELLYGITFGVLLVLFVYIIILRIKVNSIIGERR